DTVHILANGDVVICEVQDRVTIGNLGRHSLEEIWNGPAYTSFRRQYLSGKHPACASCAWRRTVSLPVGNKALVRGWHTTSGEEAQWSEASAAIAIGLQPEGTDVHVAGI